MDFGGHAIPSKDGLQVIMAIGCASALVALAIAALLPRQNPLGAGVHRH